MSETITADHLNATHLGKRITINSLHGIVMSGTLKKIYADYAIMPSLASYFPYKENKTLGTVRTFTSSCTCRTKSTTTSKQPYTRTRNYR